MSKKVEEGSEKIRIVGLPKGTVLWPTAITAIIGGIIALMIPSSADTISMIFLVIFTLNLMILFFEFSRGVVVGIFGIIIAIIALLISFGDKLNLSNVSSGLKTGVSGASGEFLLLFGGILLLMILLGWWFKKTFNYYEITRNELIEKTGILGDARRYSTPDMIIRKAIPDIFESLILFGSGRLTLIPHNKDEVFIIENVPRINKVEDKIRELLSKIDVDVNS